MSFLSIQHLQKQYDGVHALEDFSLEVEQGEFIALLGPSGCGKSTTLKMIAGLESSTAGSININGSCIEHLPPGERNLSMVFQSYALFPHMSVTENILFGLKARKVNKQEQQKRLHHALELLDLTSQQRKKPSQLSGGQCQRVALARSIVSQSPLCLMDEPLSNLDSKLRQDMRSEIRDLQQQLGLTVIYVTHDQVEAMSMADRIVLLNQGRIEQTGTPESFYKTPQSTFVADFIGQPAMNLLHTEDQIIGIRPQDIIVSAQTTDLTDHRSYSTKVISCEYQGNQSVIKLDGTKGQIVCVQNGKVQYPKEKALYLQWPLSAEHYFDSESGQRLNSNFPNHLPSAQKEPTYV